VLQAGTPEEIYRQPAGQTVAEFLGRCNILTAKVADVAPAEGSAGLILTLNGKRITAAVDGLVAGDEVQLVVRPETVELIGRESAAESAAAENTYQAEVRTVAFLGDRYLYELDADGLPVTVTSIRSVEGSSVMVRIPPSECKVLPA
jgi:ABC-type Fe3+/spermidine/putrescine transport system ATPase subunit